MAPKKRKGGETGQGPTAAKTQKTESPPELEMTAPPEIGMTAHPEPGTTAPLEPGTTALPELDMSALLDLEIAAFLESGVTAPPEPQTTAPTPMSENGKAITAAGRHPGDEEHLETFIAINEDDPVTDESMVAAYLGFHCCTDLRTFVISWPVLDCVRLTMSLMNCKRKNEVLKVYVANRRDVQKDGNPHEKWPLHDEEDHITFHCLTYLHVANHIYNMQKQVKKYFTELTDGYKHQFELVAQKRFKLDTGLSFPPDRICAQAPRLRNITDPEESELEEFNRCFEVLRYMRRSLLNRDLWAQRFGAYTRIMSSIDPIPRQYRPGWMRDIPLAEPAPQVNTPFWPDAPELIPSVRRG